MSSSSASIPRSVWTRRRRRLSARAYSYKRNLLVGGRYWQSLCSGFFGSVGLGGISDEPRLDGPAISFEFLAAPIRLQCSAWKAPGPVTSASEGSTPRAGPLGTSPFIGTWLE